MGEAEGVVVVVVDGDFVVVVVVAFEVDGELEALEDLALVGAEETIGVLDAGLVVVLNEDELGTTCVVIVFELVGLVAGDEVDVSDGELANVEDICEAELVKGDVELELANVEDACEAELVKGNVELELEDVAMLLADVDGSVTSEVDEEVDAAVEVVVVVVTGGLAVVVVAAAVVVVDELEVAVPSEGVAEHVDTRRPFAKFIRPSAPNGSLVPSGTVPTVQGQNQTAIKNKFTYRMH